MPSHYIKKYHAGQKKKMKTQITLKQLKQMFSKRIAIGYCDASNLLKFEEPIAYTAGVYGWNNDIYAIDGCAIVTGYRNLCGNINYNRSRVRDYDEKAYEIICDNSIDWETKKSKVKTLLDSFIMQALNDHDCEKVGL